MDQEYQRAVTRICVETALLLLQHGAESAVVVQMAQRLGVALGIESVECALTANAVLLTTLSKQHCITTCLLYTSPSPRDRSLSRMPSSA